jgi:two-component system sensor histidine kinase DegS
LIDFGSSVELLLVDFRPFRWHAPEAGRPVVITKPLTVARSATVRTLKNPHFWVVLAAMGILLFIYHPWPWSPQQLQGPFWHNFSWLRGLESLALRLEFKYEVFGALFLIPITYASVTLSWPGGIFAWALSMIWVLPTVREWHAHSVAFNLALLLLPVLIVAVISGERRWRESERRNYAEREQERATYIARLVETQEAERTRIAQELHDETLQTLMVIANKADSLGSSAKDKGQIEGNLWVKKEVLQTMDNIRRLSMNLRPSILDNFGLVSGVRWLANNCNEQRACHADVVITGDEPNMSSLSQVTVFRVVQEALNNMQRHARARTGMVKLDFQQDRVLMEIRDDGVGFQPPERLGAYVTDGKLGIMGMEQRILSVGGEIHVDSVPGRGTKIWASVPYTLSAEVVQAQQT